jgi:hypothetical protein
MYTANLPGFTAEASLDTSRGRYSAAVRYGRRAGRAITSQLPTIGLGDQGGGGGDEPECIWRCYWRCGRYGCFPTNCYQLCF